MSEWILVAVNLTDGEWQFLGQLLVSASMAVLAAVFGSVGWIVNRSINKKDKEEENQKEETRELKRQLEAIKIQHFEMYGLLKGARLLGKHHDYPSPPKIAGESA